MRVFAKSGPLGDGYMLPVDKRRPSFYGSYMEPWFFVIDRELLRIQVPAFLKLCHDAALSPDRITVAPGRVRSLPQDLQKSEKNTAGLGGLVLTIDEARSYDDLLYYLTHLRETEWLSTAQLDGRLWQLACEVSLSPSEYSTDDARLAQADTFLSAILHDLQSYQVIFTVRHIAPPAEPVNVWDAQLVTATSKILEPFLVGQPPEWREQSMTPFLGHPVLIVPVVGTAEAPAIEHARVVATHRLHVLRLSLASDRHTASSQLLFTLGDHALIGPAGVLTWRAPPALPHDLELHATHQQRLHDMQELFVLLPTCHPTVAQAIERAIEWIGRGLCRHWPGDAIRDYTTAVEVLLVAREKDRKSVCVPYRMLALAELHGRPTIHPTAIYHAYDRRSIVVHEGLALAGDDEATRYMLAAARDCIRWLAQFSGSQSREDHGTLLDALDTPTGRSRAIAWLTLFSDPWSTRLVAGIRRLPK